MSVPLNQALRVGAYVVKQHLIGRKRYPLVLMLEPLFRCNLACAGCGKIDYPAEILNQRLSVAECLEAVDECGAPVVVIAGGEPLLHKEIDQVVARAPYRAQEVRHRLHQRAAAGKEDGPVQAQQVVLLVGASGWRRKTEHDISVCQDGRLRQVRSRRSPSRSGAAFAPSLTARCSTRPNRKRSPRSFDEVMAMGVDGISVSPGYAYERAPDQQHFLNRTKPRSCSAASSAVRAKVRGRSKWAFNQSSMFLDFLAGNQTFHCTPWGNPTRTYFGWQRPCYLLGEGYTKTYKELMETTDWDRYGTGNYEKCADCMVHSGYEASAVAESVRKPWRAAAQAMRGIRTEGPMAPDISLANQRPAEYVFGRHVETALKRIRAGKKPTEEVADAAD